MDIFLIGGTGVVGRRVAARLQQAGHDVTGLARSPDAEVRLRALGVRPVWADLFDPGTLRWAFAGRDAVVNLATAIPPARTARKPGAWAANDRIRTEGSAAVAGAALDAGVGLVVQESIAFNYVGGAGDWLDESTPLARTPFTGGVEAAEASAARVTAGGGRGVVLRFGGHYGPDTEHTQLMLRMARRGVFLDLGADGSYFPFVATGDAATAVVAALDAPAGTYNVVDDEPLTGAERSAALVAAVGRRRLRPLPGVVRRMAGDAAKLVEPSMRVANHRFVAATGWRPQYPSVREGWAALTGVPTAASFAQAA